MDQFSSFFESSLPVQNIYYELAHKSSEGSSTRQQMFNYKDILNQVNETETNDVELENKDEYDTIKTYVQKGKDILLSELEKHKVLTMQKSHLDEFETLVKNTCIECQHKITQIKTHFDKHGFVTTELQDHIDGAVYAIGCIFDLTSNSVKHNSETIKKDMDKNNAVIKYLSNTYNIFKNTTMGHVCPVCLTNEVNTFCDPCGHSFCNKCMHASYCYICRVKINKLLPLFFP